MGSKNILIAGESWTVHSIHQKGFDSFTTTEYAEGGKWLIQALKHDDWNVTYQPSHIAATHFPIKMQDLREYDCIILSDIGANTLLLHPETFTQSKSMPNRLDLLRDYVEQGGGFMMVGGYLTFQGIDGKARYANTAIEEILPVTMLQYDDRVECPEGITPSLELMDHPILNDLNDKWPSLLGYNQVQMKASSELIASIGADPLIASGTYGAGRTIAFTSDCGPHWAPPEFVNWRGFSKLWSNMVSWASGKL